MTIAHASYIDGGATTIEGQSRWSLMDQLTEVCHRHSWHLYDNGTINAGEGFLKWDGCHILAALAYEHAEFGEQWSHEGGFGWWAIAEVSDVEREVLGLPDGSDYVEVHERNDGHIRWDFWTEAQYEVRKAELDELCYPPDEDEEPEEEEAEDNDNDENNSPSAHG